MNSRSVALQGIGFGVRRVSVQGFGPDLDHIDDSGGDVLGGGLSGRIQRQNEWILEAIKVLLVTGFLK